MIGKLILYGLAFVGALTMLGGGFIVSVLFYYAVIEPGKELKQHKTNLKALKRHWEAVAVEEH